MNNIKRSLITVVLMFLVACFMGSEGLSAEEFDNKPVADEMIDSSGITCAPKVNYSQLALTISRPNGTVFSKTFNSGSSLYASLSEIFGDSYQDGSSGFTPQTWDVAGNETNVFIRDATNDSKLPFKIISRNCL